MNMRITSADAAASRRAAKGKRRHDPAPAVCAMAQAGPARGKQRRGATSRHGIYAWTATKT